MERMIVDGVYVVGGSRLSHPDDAAVFVIDCNSELVLIDAGAGAATNKIIKNIEASGLQPELISTIILTHCHVDHIGSAGELRERFGAKLVMHHLDVDAVESADSIRTAANWYDTIIEPLRIDRHLRSKEENIFIGDQKLSCLHAPGHTPGSIVVHLERAGKKLLFGQDIHGPFLPAFSSDIALWKKSMEEILSLQPDILCEGHLGIFAPFEKIAQYINACLQEQGFGSGTKFYRTVLFSKNNQKTVTLP